MKAVIVAGGRGERLRPLTDSIPKPMIEVGGKPILLYTVELLKQAGITDYVFSLCYLPHVIQDYFGDGSQFDISIEYTFEDPSHPLGNAGGVKLAEHLINDTFVLTYADIIRELDVATMIEQHKKTNAFATINTYKRFGENPKSMIDFDENNKIISFVERPSPEMLKEDFVWANGSLYILEAEVFSFISANTDYDFGKHVFPDLLSKGKPLYAFPSEGYFIDIGTKEKLEKAERNFSLS